MVCAHTGILFSREKECNEKSCCEPLLPRGSSLSPAPTSCVVCCTMSRSLCLGVGVGGPANLACSEGFNQHVIDSVSVLLQEPFTLVLHLCREKPGPTASATSSPLPLHAPELYSQPRPPGFPPRAVLYYLFSCSHSSRSLATLLLSPLLSPALLPSPEVSSGPLSSLLLSLPALDFSRCL